MARRPRQSRNSHQRNHRLIQGWCHAKEGLWNLKGPDWCTWKLGSGPQASDRSQPPWFRPKIQKYEDCVLGWHVLLYHGFNRDLEWVYETYLGRDQVQRSRTQLHCHHPYHQIWPTKTISGANLLQEPWQLEWFDILKFSNCCEPTVLCSYRRTKWQLRRGAKFNRVQASKYRFDHLSARTRSKIST